MITWPGFHWFIQNLGQNFALFLPLAKTLHVQSFQHSICFPIGYNRAPLCQWMLCKRFVSQYVCFEGLYFLGGKNKYPRIVPL